MRFLENLEVCNIEDPPEFSVHQIQMTQIDFGHESAGSPVGSCLSWLTVLIPESRGSISTEIDFASKHCWIRASIDAGRLVAIEDLVFGQTFAHQSLRMFLDVCLGPVVERFQILGHARIITNEIEVASCGRRRILVERAWAELCAQWLSLRPEGQIHSLGAICAQWAEFSTPCTHLRCGQLEFVEVCHDCFLIIRSKKIQTV